MSHSKEKEIIMKRILFKLVAYFFFVTLVVFGVLNIRRRKNIYTRDLLGSFGLLTVTYYIIVIQLHFYKTATRTRSMTLGIKLNDNFTKNLT